MMNSKPPYSISERTEYLEYCIEGTEYSVACIYIMHRSVGCTVAIAAKTEFGYS